MWAYVLKKISWPTLLCFFKSFQIVCINNSAFFFLSGSACTCRKLVIVLLVFAQWKTNVFSCTAAAAASEHIRLQRPYIHGWMIHESCFFLGLICFACLHLRKILKHFLIFFPVLFSSGLLHFLHCCNLPSVFTALPSSKLPQLFVGIYCLHWVWNTAKHREEYWVMSCQPSQPAISKPSNTGDNSLNSDKLSANKTRIK